MEEIAMKWLKRIAIVVAVLLIVPLVTLLALGHRAGAGKMQVAVEINAPPEQVWTWIDDNDRLKQWVSWLVEVKSPDPQKAHGVGGTRILVMKDENNGGALIQIVGKCSEYQPPSRLTMQMADTEGMFDGQEAYQLVDLGNGRTRVEIHSSFHYGVWFANLMEPLITPQAEKKMVSDLARLKLLAESRASLR
jgi:uncharacterized protein YndB with AHSA1/START domain